MASDIAHINQPGRMEPCGTKVRLGEMGLAPVDPENPDGPKKLDLKLGRICVKLGNGISVSTELAPVPGCVPLAVTAEAAKRMGWPHPANEQKAPANLANLQAIVGNQKYGQEEQRTALRQIREIDPELGAALARANVWLEAA